MSICIVQSTRRPCALPLDALKVALRLEWKLSIKTLVSWPTYDKFRWPTRDNLKFNVCSKLRVGNSLYQGLRFMFNHFEFCKKCCNWELKCKWLNNTKIEVVGWLLRNNQTMRVFIKILITQVYKMLCWRCKFCLHVSSITRTSFGLMKFSKWDEGSQNKRGVRWHIFLRKMF